MPFALVLARGPIRWSTVCASGQFRAVPVAVLAQRSDQGRGGRDALEGGGGAPPPRPPPGRPAYA